MKKYRRSDGNTPTLETTYKISQGQFDEIIIKNGRNNCKTIAGTRAADMRPFNVSQFTDI